MKETKSCRQQPRIASLSSSLSSLSVLVVVVVVVVCVVVVFPSDSNGLPHRSLTNDLTPNISTACQQGFTLLNSNITFVEAYANVTAYFKTCITQGLDNLTGDTFASCYDTIPLYKDACDSGNASFCHSYWIVWGNSSWHGQNGTEMLVRFDGDLCLPDPCHNTPDLDALAASFNATLCSFHTSWANCTSSAYLSCESISIGSIITIVASIAIFCIVLIGALGLWRIIRRKPVQDPLLTEESVN